MTMIRTFVKFVAAAALALPSVQVAEYQGKGVEALSIRKRIGMIYMQSICDDIGSMYGRFKDRGAERRDLELLDHSDKQLGMFDPKYMRATAKHSHSSTSNEWDEDLLYRSLQKANFIAEQRLAKEQLEPSDRLLEKRKRTERL